MWLRWLPWKYLIRRVATAQGFLDPFSILDKLERFAQRSEVSVPVELLRAGVAFHARGLLNTKAIQTNLDWVWPYWVRRQFDPADEAFVPRAFSATHVNLTNRNWTAVGLPGLDAYPLIDPRGMVTPLHDGWSLDTWIIPDEGTALFPSRINDDVLQEQSDGDESFAVSTVSRSGALALRSTCTTILRDGRPVCHLDCEASGEGAGWLVVSLRPFNPEGVSLVGSVGIAPERNAWVVNEDGRVEFNRTPDRFCASRYMDGDVCSRLVGDACSEEREPPPEEVDCPVGLASAAALFRLDDAGRTRVGVDIPLDQGGDESLLLSTPALDTTGVGTWHDALQSTAGLSVPDEHFVALHDAAVRTLILLSPGDVVPGPYTYRRFWFRDAAFMINGLLAANLVDRAQEALRRFPQRQSALGYFRSQDGEWDSNGEAMWVMHRFHRQTASDPADGWRDAMRHGAHWIRRKRCAKDDSPHAGLLPAGFSAEHFGNNDYYYWDDFWAVAGLRAAADVMRDERRDADATRFDEEADDLMHCIHLSLDTARQRLRVHAMPASPYRRMDAGAIGSIVAGYPLTLLKPTDPALLGTTDYLVEGCFREGAFFQDMIHSGLNAYLSLHVAQVLLRAGDPRYLPIVERVAALASPTGHWPEAVHPRTGGGCMGDGQHGWAAAEWVLMMRALFIREEAGQLILGSGIPQHWLDGQDELEYGPTPTAHGPVTVRLRPTRDKVEVRWDAQWRQSPPEIEMRLPGCEAMKVSAAATSSCSILRTDPSRPRP